MAGWWLVVAVIACERHDLETTFEAGVAGEGLVIEPAPQGSSWIFFLLLLLLLLLFSVVNAEWLDSKKNRFQPFEKTHQVFTVGILRAKGAPESSASATFPTALECSFGGYPMTYRLTICGN